jgi:hypothetical protein
VLARKATPLTALLFRGIHEVCRKRLDGGISHVGYFDSAEAALDIVKGDLGYEAIWASLNDLPRVPEGFVLNRLQASPHRSKKEWYQRRVKIVVDCDPIRTHGEKKSNATDAEKAASRAQAEAIRRFLCDELQWPQPIVCDSGNGTHLLWFIELPNDQAAEDLIRALLSGLAAKFDNEQSHVDTGNFESNRVIKLPGTWARKAPEAAGRPWRLSQILEVPERTIELPASANRPRELVTEIDLEPVARTLLVSTAAQLPVPQKAAAGVTMPANDVLKYEWLRSFLLQFNVTILAERASGKRLFFDVICPWESEHGSTTVDSSTSVWYTRGFGYGYSCKHSKCAEEKRGWYEFSARIDPEEVFSVGLPGLPTDATHAQISRYFIEHCPESHNHVRIYDVGQMRATFVGSRFDLIDQSNVLLMSALQPVCDRLRFDMPEKRGRPDYRRVLESHPFRSSAMMQTIPMLDKIRFEQLDANPYLIGLPGGLVGDLRTAQTRQMELSDYLTRRLRTMAKDGPRQVYSYFMQSISSSNDQPADLEWIAWMELLLGYCLLGSQPYHIWPLWTGEGGNGKSCLARLVSYILGEFCALVRWSELTHDERGGDSTQKRLNYRLIGSRVAIVEEMGEASGSSHRVLETSAIKNITGNGELTGAAMRQNDVRGPSNVKLCTLLNRVPFIDKDPAMERRVQIFPFRAVFDDRKFPGSVAESMEKKNAPTFLREQPDRIEAMMREEAPAILFRWMQACREFIDRGEQMKDPPDVIRKPSQALFYDSDLHGRFCDERLGFGGVTELDATNDELRIAGEAFQREFGIPTLFDKTKLEKELKARGCQESRNLGRSSPSGQQERKRGWLGVKVLQAKLVIRS